MMDPDLYSQLLEAGKNDASYFLETYGKLLNWGSNENVLDVGMGDGGVTLDCLLPKIPTNFKKLVGVDINNEMVTILKAKTQNPKIDFSVLDITTSTIPVDFQENFHHIFSFYTLNWIQDQRATFSNMYKMLKPGGELFVTCVVQSCHFEVMEAMANKEKWKLFTPNYKDYISVYKYSNNPEKEVKKYFENEGFICRLCQIDNRKQTFKEFNLFKGFMCALNPLCQQIPEEERDDYINEYITAFENIENVTIHKAGGEKKVELSYSTMVAIASKPFSQK